MPERSAKNQRPEHGKQRTALGESETGNAVNRSPVHTRLGRASANPTVAAATGAVVGAAATAIVAILLQNNSDGTAKLQPPSIKISSLRYVGQPKDRYQVQGVVRNLAPLQAVWSFNQPVSGKDLLGPIHADPGPCSVSPQGIFTCDLGEAVTSAATAYFNIIVAVVTESQAADFAKQKAGIENLQDYGSLAALPTAQGSNITDTDTLPAQS